MRTKRSTPGLAFFLFMAMLLASPLSAARRVALLRLDRGPGVSERIASLFFASTYLSFAYDERFDTQDPGETDRLRKPAERLPGTAGEAAELAKKLGCDSIIYGRLSIENGFHQLTLQLVDASGRTLNRQTVLIPTQLSSRALVQAIEQACHNLSHRLTWEQPGDFPVTFMKAGGGSVSLPAQENEIRSIATSMKLPRGVEVDRVLIEVNTRREVGVFGYIGMATIIGACFFPFWDDRSEVSIHLYVKRLEATGVVEEEFKDTATSHSWEHLFIKRAASDTGLTNASVEGIKRITETILKRSDLMQPRETGLLPK